jgi:hypothetical protein
MGLDSYVKKMLTEVAPEAFVRSTNGFIVHVIALDVLQLIMGKPAYIQSGMGLLEHILMIAKSMANVALIDCPPTFMLFDGPQVSAAKDPCHVQRAQTVKAEMVPAEYHADVTFSRLPPDWNSMKVDREYRAKLVMWLIHKLENASVTWADIRILRRGEADYDGHYLSVKCLKPGEGVFVATTDSDVILSELLGAPDRAADGQFQTYMYLKTYPTREHRPMTVSNVAKAIEHADSDPALRQQLEGYLQELGITREEALEQSNAVKVVLVPQYIDMNKLWLVARQRFGGDPMSDEDDVEWVPPTEDVQLLHDELDSVIVDDDDDDAKDDETISSESEDKFIVDEMPTPTGPVTLHPLPGSQRPYWAYSFAAFALLLGQDLVIGWDRENEQFCKPIPYCGAALIQQSWEEIQDSIGPLARYTEERGVELQMLAMWQLVRTSLLKKMSTKLEGPAQKRQRRQYLPTYAELCQVERTYRGNKHHLPDEHGMVLNFLAVRYAMHNMMFAWRGTDDAVPPADEVHPRTGLPLHGWVRSADTGKCVRCEPGVWVYDPETRERVQHCGLVHDEKHLRMGAHMRFLNHLEDL